MVVPLLSELVGESQLRPLVAALSRLTGLPVALFEREGVLLATSLEQACPPESDESLGSGERLISLPVQVASEVRGILVLGPYHPAGHRRLPGTAKDRPPILSLLRVEVVRARAQALVQLLGEMGGQALELRREAAERRRAEAALRDREYQYRSLVEQMREGILAGDLATRITFVNPAMAEMLGYREEELLGRPFYEFMAPEIRPRYLARIARRHTGESERYETELIRKDGERISISLSAVPLRDVQGMVIGSFGVISDLTEKKRSEKAIRESEEKFRRIFESMQDVFYRGDAEGRLTLMSPSGARLLGYDSADALIGKSIAEAMYLDPQDRKRFLEAIHEKGFVRDYKVTLRKADGRPVLVATDSRLVLDERGRDAGVEGVFYDITERVKSEEALRQSEERYRLIVDNIQDVIFTHLPDGCVSFVSGSVRHLGYRPEDCLSLNLFQFVHPEDLETARNAFLRTLNTKQGSAIELRVLCKDGSYLWMEEKSDPVLQDGRITQVTCVLRDISKRKAAEEALRRSEYKYSRIIHNIRDIVYSYTPDGILTFVSESVRQLGYEHDEIVGYSIFSFLHPDDRNLVFEANRNAMDRGGFEPVECRLRTKGGDYVWVEASSEQVLVGGHLVQINGVARYIAERKAAEEALRLSEERYRSLINNIQDIIFSHQPDGRVSFASESVRRLGYEPEEVAGRPIFEFLHPDDVPGARVVLEHARSEHRQAHLEFRFRAKGGGYVWFEENSEPIFEDGRLVQFNAVARDITSRREAESALRESEAKYKWLLEQLNEGILVGDLQGVISFVNPRMAEMLGYADTELLGRPMASLAEGPWPGIHAGRNESRGAGFNVQQEIRLQRKNGDPVHFLVSGTPLRNGDGEVVGTFSVLSDITQWKRDQEELTRLSTAIEQASDSIIITDTRGLILYANPASQEITGCPLALLVGSSLEKFRGSQHPDAFYQDMWSRVMKGETWSGRIANTREDGAHYETASTISPVRDSSGRIQYVVMSSKDITRESELEAQLRHSQRMEAIGVLAGGIAHDFNNILTPVIGYTEMALGRPGLDTRVADYLNEIASAGRRASELVQQILTFSRQAEQVKQPVQVDAIVKETIKLLRAGIPSTIAIRQRIGAMGVQALADASQIHQVVMNLCTNAFHAMREKGGVMEVSLDPVTLEAPLVLMGTTLPAGDYLRLKVSDTGPGMDESTQKKIFLPFFTTKRVGEGTGLGLSIVHGIVVGMGGSIAVESQVGSGTTFTVYLPAVHQDLQEAVATAQSLPKGSERLLVLDDESVIGAMLQDALTFFGYEVETSDSSIEALDRILRDPGRFDLVITDLTMPDLTGLELARKLWEIRAELPVVLMTGYTENLDETSAVSMGFEALLRKPVSLSLIGQTVRAALDRRQAAR